MKVLSNGSVLFVDELNERLHTNVVENLIELFLDKSTNPKNAQLIFTTHDVSLLNSEIFRRDEIWFAEKNESGESRVKVLSEINGKDGSKIRKDENFEKNYIDGKYGATPSIKQIQINID